MANLDAVLLLDFSGTMSTQDAGSGGSLTRLAAMQESAKAFATELEKYDADGITVGKFAGKVRLYDGVTATKVDDIFKENRAMGGTATDVALNQVATKFLTKQKADVAARKAAGSTDLTPTPIFVGIFTDGQPDNPLGLAQEIVKITKQIANRKDFGILFVQVGKDAEAAAFLEKLNSQLESVGADHDIVAVCKLDDLEDLTTDEIVAMAFTE